MFENGYEKSDNSEIWKASLLWTEQMKKERLDANVNYYVDTNVKYYVHNYVQLHISTSSTSYSHFYSHNQSQIAVGNCPVKYCADPRKKYILN